MAQAVVIVAIQTQGFSRWEIRIRPGIRGLGHFPRRGLCRTAQCAGVRGFGPVRPRSWSGVRQGYIAERFVPRRSGKTVDENPSGLRRWGQPQAGRRLAAYPAARLGQSGVGALPRAEAGFVVAERRRLRAIERGRRSAPAPDWACPVPWLLGWEGPATVPRRRKFNAAGPRSAKLPVACYGHPVTNSRKGR